MLRPRNGNTPPVEPYTEPDTPLSHYVPEMSSTDQEKRQGGSDFDHGNIAAAGSHYSNEKRGSTSSASGLGLASRRGEKTPTLTLATNGLIGKGKGKNVKLGMWRKRIGIRVEGLI